MIKNCVYDYNDVSLYHPNYPIRSIATVYVRVFIIRNKLLIIDRCHSSTLIDNHVTL